MDTCVELIYITNPIEADLGNIVQGYLPDVNSIRQTDVLDSSHQVVIARDAMYTSNAHLMQAAEKILGYIDGAFELRSPDI